MLLNATIEKGAIALNENAPEWVINILINFLGKTEGMKPTARLVVMNGQRCYQVKSDNADWTTKEIEKAGGIKPGVYMISGAAQADKLRIYTGFVLHSDDFCVYQQADKTIVRHALRDFDDQPSCGKSFKIMYAASGKAVITPAEVHKMGRSLGR